MRRALDLVDAGLDAARREADDAVGRHRVGRIVRVDVRHALVVDRQGARLADAEVGGRVERVGRARAGEGERVRAGRLARERKARAGHGDRLAEGDGDARAAGDVDRAVRRSRARDGRRVVARRRRRVRSRARRTCRWRSRPTRRTGRRRRSRSRRRPRSLALRRSVLSAVLVSPVPHSVPGSTPIWPITSRIVVPLRRTTASSPLNQPGSVRLVGLREDRGARARLRDARRRRRRRPCRSGRSSARRSPSR